MTSQSLSEKLKCLFGIHEFEETGIRVGAMHVEVICVRCNKLSRLHLVHDVAEIVKIRREKGEKP